jgi:hypothetical protein
MAVTVTIRVTWKGRSAGGINWTFLHPESWIGKLKSIEITPQKLADELKRRLTNNEDVVVRRGGILPDDPSEYWETVIRVLEKVKETHADFNYEAPPPPDMTNKPGPGAVS